MTAGLDKIIEEILSEAQKEADGIISEAKAKAESILGEARTRAGEDVKSIEMETGRQIAAMAESRETAFALRRKRAALEARQAVLEETLSAARQSLIDLPGNEYFALVLKLAASQALDGAGELAFNANDQARMPKNFQHLLNLSLSEGKTLTVSDAPARIDGGFVLRYGDLEENCSFAAVFRERRDEFIDLIRRSLFEG